MLKEILVFIASLLALVGNLPYLFDVVKKKIKPHPYTWFVWSIVSCVIFFGQVAKGAGIGAIPTAASEVFTVIIFLFSLKYGFKNPPKSDKFFWHFLDLYLGYLQMIRQYQLSLLLRSILLRLYQHLEKHLRTQRVNLHYFSLQM